MPAPFSSITDVRLSAPVPQAIEPDNTPEGKPGGMLGRSFSFMSNSKESQADRELVVKTGDRILELLCPSATDALTWFQALSAAKDVGEREAGKETPVAMEGGAQ